MRRAALVATVAALPLLFAAGPAATTGAPRQGGRFMNPADPLDRGGLVSVALPFFVRKAWTTLVPRAGAAPLVAFDRRKMMRNPSLTWIGHSTMLVRMDGVTFLTDPVFSDRASPLSWAGPRRLVPPGVPVAELPPIEFATLSHDHYDHTDVPSIRALAARGTRFIVPFGLGDVVRAAGGEATELDWWQSAAVGSARVHCVPAQHFSGRGLTDHGQRLWAGWVVEGPTRRFYHAGDTGYFSGMREIGERLGPIDLAALPIGAYEPQAMMRAVHLNPEEAARAAVDVRAARVVAMHWGTFDLTDEPLDEPPRRFRAAAAAAGYDAPRAWMLAIGESRRW
jgi:N-acyl-phosphatidylethanolamine-hydrolysing phospholipase D